jgi:glycosyltransferase involved in cell wall biosynthesis
VRILWAIANWKRTGPVEPSLDLAAALRRRGHEVLVLTGRPVGTAPDEAGEAAEARGLTRLDLGLRLSKHRGLLAYRRDAALLAAHLRARPPDVVQTTLRNDHRTVAAAVRRAALDVPVVRFWFEAPGVPPGRAETDRLRAAARVVAFSVAAEAALVTAGVAPERVLRLAPPVDVDRLRRAATAGSSKVRARLGIPSDAMLVGVVARVQPHRRFELLWEAARRLVSARAPVRLLVIGRGTRIDAVARRPVAEGGIADAVTFAGYLRGAEYASTLAALDVQAFLVPGSDPTCRALREGMALGVPSVATRRGMLPEIVDDGTTGLLVDETPEALALALSTLADDAGLRRRLGAAAAEKAARAFSPPRAAEALERGYLAIATGPGSDVPSTAR